MSQFEKLTFEVQVSPTGFRRDARVDLDPMIVSVMQTFDQDGKPLHYGDANTYEVQVFAKNSDGMLVLEHQTMADISNLLGAMGGIK